MEKEILKQNILKLAKEHKEHCPGKECTISLYQVRLIVEAAGITLNNDEKMILS